MTTKRYAAACAMTLVLAGCSGHSNSTHSASSASTLSGTAQVGHWSFNQSGYRLISQPETTYKVFQYDNGTSFVKFIANGALPYVNISPEQEVKANLGHELGQQGAGLSSPKIVSAHTVAIPGGGAGYSMSVTGMNNAKQQVRQEIVCVQSPRTHEMALFTITAVTDKQAIASRTLSSLTFIPAKNTLGPHKNASAADLKVMNANIAKVPHS